MSRMLIPHPCRSMAATRRDSWTSRWVAWGAAVELGQCRYPLAVCTPGATLAPVTTTAAARSDVRSFLEVVV
jgi:hypothetical protein